MSELRTSIRGCRACPLWEQCIGPVPYDLAPADIAFVGEAPGAEEDAQGRGFVGPTGQYLRVKAAEFGLDLGSAAMLNVVKCRPTQPGRWGRLVNRTPTQAEVEFCADLWLEQELEIVRPKVIVAVGGSATDWFAGKHVSITKASGTLTLEWHGHLVVPIVHPSYVTRGARDGVRAFEEGLRLVRRSLGNAPRLSVVKVEPEQLVGVALLGVDFEWEPEHQETEEYTDSKGKTRKRKVRVPKMFLSMQIGDADYAAIIYEFEAALKWLRIYRLTGSHFVFHNGIEGDVPALEEWLAKRGESNESKLSATES